MIYRALARNYIKMKKKTIILLSLLIIFAFPIQKVAAEEDKTDPRAAPTLDCNLSAFYYYQGVTTTTEPADTLILKFENDEIQNRVNFYTKINGKLVFSFPGDNGRCGRRDPTGGETTNSPEFRINGGGLDFCDNYLFLATSKKAELIYAWPGYFAKICKTKTFSLSTKKPSCKVNVTADGSRDPLDPSWKIIVSEITDFPSDLLDVKIEGASGITFSSQWDNQTRTAGINMSTNMPNPGNYYAVVYPFDPNITTTEEACRYEFRVAVIGEPTPTPTPPPPNICFHLPLEEACDNPECCPTARCQNAPQCEESEPPTEIKAEAVCERLKGQVEKACESTGESGCEYKGQEAYNKCENCFNKEKVWTAFGCIPTKFDDLMTEYILGYGIGIAGGIAFLLFLAGGYKIMFSQGVAESITEGKQMITSALIGLLVIVLSVFILEFIGVHILNIPGFGL